MIYIRWHTLPILFLAEILRFLAATCVKHISPIVYTPETQQLDPKNGSDWKMIFLFQLGSYSGPMLVFRGIGP